MKMLIGLVCILFTLTLCLFYGSMATVGFIKFAQDFKLPGITDNGQIMSGALYFVLVTNIIFGIVTFYFLFLPAIIHRLDLWRWLDRDSRIQEKEMKIMGWFASNAIGYVESIRRNQAHKKTIIDVLKAYE